jgi:hypothetical protein
MIKTHIQKCQVHILAATSVPFRPMKVQMPNLALIETKRITVYMSFEFFWEILVQEVGMHVWWIWPTVLVENQPSGLYFLSRRPIK